MSNEQTATTFRSWLPTMTGMDLCERVRARWPGREDHFVFLTGGTDTPEAREFLRNVKNPRAYKPIHMSQLISLIQDCVEPPSAPPADAPP